MNCKEHKVLEVFGRIRQQVEFELKRETDPPHGLSVYDVLQYLTYEQFKLQAVDMIRESLRENSKEIRKVSHAKGKTIQWYRTPGVNRLKLLHELEEARDQFLAWRMEDERQEQEDCANDDRDACYDDGIWAWGRNLDPDYKVPIVQWAKINKDGS